jgi:hypothetical protein
VNERETGTLQARAARKKYFRSRRQRPAFSRPPRASQSRHRQNLSRALTAQKTAATGATNGTRLAQTLRAQMVTEPRGRRHIDELHRIRAAV